jgi:hypothetical protein
MSYVCHLRHSSNTPKPERSTRSAKQNLIQTQTPQPMRPRQQVFPTQCSLLWSIGFIDHNTIRPPTLHHLTLGILGFTRCSSRRISSSVMYRGPPMNCYDALESTLPMLPSVLYERPDVLSRLRRRAVCEAASICFLVCWCMILVYEERSLYCGSL